MTKYNYLEKMSYIFNKPSIWTKILFVSILILIIISLFNKDKIETFIDNTEFEQKQGSLIYDDFYADIYDYLVYSSIKNTFEIRAIENTNYPAEKSRVLDIGCATGHTVDMLKKKGFDTVGIDTSHAMIEKAKHNYPDNEYIEGDANNNMMFQQDSFTQIFCLYFTLYYFKDKTQFFSNCYKWLIPGGSLIVHVVDGQMFDPILPPANPLLMLTPQRYADERITQSKLSFDDFNYISNFVYNGTNTKFVERFINKDTGKTFRKNEHLLYMEPESEILEIAKNCGFIIQGKLDMIKAGYEYQYLYILQKPQ